MNTLFFKYAIEVNKAGSITKAAQNLYMAQPNLSKAIRELEESLGYPIFERKKCGMVPTEKGITFLVYARDILERIQELEKLSEDDNDMDNVQKFKIATPRGSYIANGFTEFVSELCMEQRIELTIRETNAMQTIDLVADEKFNLGIVRFQNCHEKYFVEYMESKRLQVKPVWEFENLIVMSRKHPLASMSSIKCEDLSQYIEICHGDAEIPCFDYGSELCKKSAKKADKKIYVFERGSQFDLLTSVPQTFMWVSPIPERHIKQYDLVQKCCGNSSKRYKDVLVCRKGYEFTELDLLFQEKLFLSKSEVSASCY